MMRRLFLWLSCLCLLGTALVMSPLSTTGRAQAATTLYQHDNIEWPDAVAGDVSISQKIQVDNPQAGHFWSSFFDITPDVGNPLDEAITGGYMGIQAYGYTPVSRYKRSALFSIWGATAASPASPNCAQWPADPANPTPSELAEGSYGMQCAIEYPWLTGEPVTLKISRDGTGSGPNGFTNPGIVNGTFWVATATRGTTTTTIGRIFVPGVVHKLRPAYNFSEQFVGTMPETCAQPGFATRARFYKPVTESNSPGGVVTTTAGTPGPQTFVNPCVTRQIVDSNLDYVVVEQGPNAVGPWAPTGDINNIDYSGSVATVYGWVDIPDDVAPVELRVRVNGTVVANGSGAFTSFSNSSPPTEWRTYALVVPAIVPGSTVCLEGRNGTIWGSVGCRVAPSIPTVSGTVSGLVNDAAGTGGRVLGQVEITGFAGQVGMRTLINGIEGPLVYSAPGTGMRAYELPFDVVPGTIICVEANRDGTWSQLAGCVSTAAVVLATVNATTAVGTVSVPTFDGAITMRATVDGVAQAESYSEVGSDARPYLVSFVATVGQTVCVEANAYGFWSRSPICQRVVNGESFAALPVPKRVYDSRQSTPVAVGTTRNVTVAGVFGVPANATAVALNIAAVAPVGAGHLRIFPAGTPLPTASVVNFATAKNTPNHVVVKVGAGGQLSVYAGNTTHVIVDVAGYFLSDGALDQYNSVTAPIRLLTQTIPAAVAGNTAPSTLNVSVLGVGGIPSVVGGSVPSVVALNIGAINPIGTGHIRVFPTGGSLPDSSTHNFIAGDSRTNLVLVRPSASGQVSIYNASGGAVTITVDTIGYFGQGGLGFKPIQPIRPLDTREPTGNPPLAAGAFIEVPIRGFGVVPNSANVKSVVLNVAAVNPTAIGSVNVGPSGSNPTLASFTHPANENVANLVMVPVGVDGKIRLVNNSSGTTHLIVDITGYFTS
jgi:hypothetical protein